MFNAPTLANGRWSVEQAPPIRFTIVFVDPGYELNGDDSTVAFDGKDVTIEGTWPGASALYTGVFEGDTIVGQMHVVAGGIAYDGPWIATRVK
jgi:hypothetical protein